MDIPSLTECIEAFAYPPCCLAGLLGGLVTRHWLLAIGIGAVVAPLVDYASAAAFSDGHPRWVWDDELLFAVIGGIAALIVRAIATAIRITRQRA